MPKLPPVIRSPVPADLPALAAIHAAHFARAWNADALAGLLTTGQGRIALDETGKPSGFVLWQQTDGAGSETDLLTLAVDPARQRQGVGRALLLALLTQIAADGGGPVFLEVSHSNTAALRLYATAGFVRVGLRRNYYDDKPAGGRDAVTMRCDVKASCKEVTVSVHRPG
jgi:[ribosomal protein S18]-alanine N-acetyltransferase